MLKGSCLCGGVAYEADRLASPIVHCHCRTCQKAHGAAFNTAARAKRSEFRWTAGDDLRRSFESTPTKLRHFCGRCGSHLMSEWLAEDEVVLRLGTLDTDPGTSAVAHIWTTHRVPWLAYGEDLPCLSEGVGSPPADDIAEK